MSLTHIFKSECIQKGIWQQFQKLTNASSAIESKLLQSVNLEKYLNAKNELQKLNEKYPPIKEDDQMETVRKTAYKVGLEISGLLKKNESL